MECMLLHDLGILHVFYNVSGFLWFVFVVFNLLDLPLLKGIVGHMQHVSDV